MALPCLEALLISKDTHSHAVCEPSHLHHFSSCKSSVWISKGAVYLCTGIHFYGFFQPTLFTLFFLKLREKGVNLILYQNIFYHISRWHHTWRVKGICVYYPAFNYCGGRMERMLGLAAQLIDWLFSFTWLIPLHCGKGFLSLFLPPLGSLCMKRNTLNDKPRLQVPCRGWRPARIAAAAPATTPSTGMTEWKDACLHFSSLLPLPSPPAPPVVQPPSLIYFC